MTARRSLRLRREALTELVPDDLDAVGAAQATPLCLVTHLATLCHLCVLLTNVGCEK